MKALLEMRVQPREATIPCSPFSVIMTPDCIYSYLPNCGGFAQTRSTSSLGPLPAGAASPSKEEEDAHASATNKSHRDYRAQWPCYPRAVCLHLHSRCGISPRGNPPG